MTILHAKSALTAQGWQSDVAVTIGPDGRIMDIGPQRGAPDHAVAILLPAPVNLHAHAFQRAMAGLTETRGHDGRDSFWTWRRLMFRFLDQLDPEDVQAIAAQAYMEMLESGFAAVAEFHYLHHGPGGVPYADPAEMSQRIIAAAQQAGIGLTLLPVMYSRGGCDGRPLQGGQRRFGCDAQGFLALHQAAGAALRAGPADFALGMAPHSLRALSAQELGEILPYAAGGPIHMHLAEQTGEVDEVLAHLGARPAEWLMGQHDIGPDWCLIHCTQMSDAETRALAATGAVVGLCPLTEASLGDGIFDGAGYMAAGGRFGFGSDSNIQISLFEEMKALEYSQRLARRARAVLAAPPRSTGRVLFDAAAQGGAQAGQRAGGAIKVGGLADLIALSDEGAHLWGKSGDQILDTLVFTGASIGAITDVFSAGRHMVKGGRHVQRGAISAQYRRVMARLSTAL